MADLIRHPLQTLYALKKEPWTVLRAFVCVGIFVGFAFWEVHMENVAPTACPHKDKLVEMFDSWHEAMDKDHSRIPEISSQILAVQYVAVIALMGIFVSRGDYILLAILCSWALGLFITLVTQLPVSPSSLRYYQGAWFPLEYFVTDYTVSWHAMMLCHCIFAITRVCPFWLLYLFAGFVFTLVCMYLMATRNTYTIAIVLGVAFAFAGRAVAECIKEWWEPKEKATEEEKKPLKNDSESLELDPL